MAIDASRMPATAIPHRRTESVARCAPRAHDYRGEHLTLRNLDPKGGYGLTVRLRDSAGRREPNDYFLGSNTTKRVFDCCEPGEVTVEVFHAGERAATLTTTVDDTPSGTAVVECARGVVTARTGPAAGPCRA